MPKLRWGLFAVLACAGGISGCAADRGALTDPGASSSASTPPVDPTLVWMVPATEPDATWTVFVTSDGKLLADKKSPQGEPRVLAGVGPEQRAASIEPIALRASSTVTVGDEKIAIVEAGSIRALDERGALLFSTPLPTEVTATALATGYGNVLFLIDGKAGRIHTVTPEGLSTLIEDPALVSTTAARRAGGRLLVGTATGLSAVNLAKPQVQSVVDTEDAVVGVALDDTGLTIIRTANGDVRTLDPDGTLSDPFAVAHSAAMDEGTTIILSTREGVVARDYAALRGRAGDPQRGPAGPFAQHGIALSGAEYWPNRGDTKTKYPEDVLWGFYPQQGEVSDGAPAVATATPEAVACMEESHAALRAWIATNPATFHEVVALSPETISPRFYLWVNDYSTASASFPHEIRKARLWYWERSPAVVGRIPGYWKWETTVLQDGTCTFPQPEQAAAFLQAKLTELRQAAGDTKQP